VCLDALGTAPTEKPAGDEDTQTPERLGFYDDFEDGDYTSALTWETSLESGIGTVEIVDHEESDSNPGGETSGTKALRISDATDEELNERGESASATLADPVDGWQGAWTLEGQFYAADVPTGEYADDVHVAIGLYDLDLELLLTPRVELLFFGSDEQSEVETRQSILDEGKWYAYELRHDGVGTYTAARWPATGDRGDRLSVTAEREPPSSPTERPALVTYGGYPEFIDQVPPSPRPDPGSSRLTADHAYVRWRPEQ